MVRTAPHTSAGEADCRGNTRRERFTLTCPWGGGGLAAGNPRPRVPAALGGSVTTRPGRRTGESRDTDRHATGFSNGLAELGSGNCQSIVKATGPATDTPTLSKVSSSAPKAGAGSFELPTALAILTRSSVTISGTAQTVTATSAAHSSRAPFFPTSIKFTSASWSTFDPSSAVSRMPEPGERSQAKSASLTSSVVASSQSSCSCSLSPAAEGGPEQVSPESTRACLLETAASCCPHQSSKLAASATTSSSTSGREFCQRVARKKRSQGVGPSGPTTSRIAWIVSSHSGSAGAKNMTSARY
mmetsp:Transcript_2381/g.5465  ORF Transcript_2381/g.5465 Transcript_2381/m.5465 type:complete len:301 (+) Transcript_2381:198-1100(+)